MVPSERAAGADGREKLEHLTADAGKTRRFRVARRGAALRYRPIRPRLSAGVLAREAKNQGRRTSGTGSASR